MVSQLPLDAFPQEFRDLLAAPELMFQALDALPVPLEVFRPDGLVLFANKAWLSLNNVADPAEFVGKLNISTDPVTIGLFGANQVAGMLRGEPVHGRGIPIPIDDLVARGTVEDRPFAAATLDYESYPIRDANGELVAAIALFGLRTTYPEPSKVTEAKQYLTKHWKAPFDATALAKAIGVTERHLRRLFTEAGAGSPLAFYNDHKITKLKDALVNPEWNVAEAFAQCGIEYNSHWMRKFKTTVGLTPKQFVKQASLTRTDLTET